MKLTLLTLIIFQIGFIFSQKKLSIIHADSLSVKIKVDGIFDQNNWTIMPEIKPDIYSTKGSKVTFYTNRDSITFKVDKKKVIDFIIVFNNKDTAYTQIKYIADVSYLSILKSAKKYNLNENRTFPNFTYQSMNDSNLVKLRKEYNLDSVVGKGNEISKILNLLHWMHNTVPHDGQHNNPEIKNSLSMISICKKENRGLNCRGLAISLNECFLSMGFKSRFVVCLPKDSIVNECHIINMVYSNDLKKWLYIDPTHDAYVMNEKGELLSIEEVRERLINGKTLILNPTANWNYTVSTVKADYLYNYMSKNLFRIECPLKSEFDFESYKSGKIYEYVELLPVNTFNQKNQEILNKDIKYINQKTNNPNLFWAKP